MSFPANDKNSVPETKTPEALADESPRADAAAFETPAIIADGEVKGSFADLGLPEEIQNALREMKFAKPTPIQEKGIPVALTGGDLIGCAATGTGKTAAFLIPSLMRMMAEPESMLLVLVPTRELASQVATVHQGLTKFLRGFGVVTLIGGVPMMKQLNVLKRKPRILIATPGRLVDHLQRGSVKLDQIKVLVLDEADRMLDMGFQPQLHEIMRYLPKGRQTLFFSATLPANILELSKKYLHHPVRVDVKTPPKKGDELRPSAQIDERSLGVDAKEKNEALLDELAKRKGTILVFARTQSRVDRVCRYLEGYDVSVTRIHGGRTQGQRTRAMDGFRKGEYRVLIATDLAARGIDVDHVAHVINYDLPQVPEDYIHRIGRTGRAGRSGEAISFVTREDAVMWKAIQRLKSGSASMGPPGSYKSEGGNRAKNGRGDQNRGDGRRDGRRNHNIGNGQGNERGNRGNRNDGHRKDRGASNHPNGHRENGRENIRDLSANGEPNGSPNQNPNPNANRRPEGRGDIAGRGRRGRRGRGGRRDGRPENGAPAAGNGESSSQINANENANFGARGSSESESSAHSTANPSNHSTRNPAPNAEPRASERNDRGNRGNAHRDDPRARRPGQRPSGNAGYRPIRASERTWGSAPADSGSGDDGPRNDSSAGSNSEPSAGSAPSEGGQPRGDGNQNRRRRRRR